MENKELNNVRNEQTETTEKVENKRNSKKRLLLLLLLLLVTGVLLGTSTYAWFTANKKVSVNDITVNVAAQNGIQISVDGTTWKSIVQTNDLLNATTKYANAVNQIPSEGNSIAPVSTVGNVDANGRMEMFLGDVKTDEETGGYILTSVKETDTAGQTGRYIAFDLFFKVEEDTPVWITPDSGVTTGDVTDMGIKNATRMAFVMLGNTSSGDTLTNIQGLNAGTSATKYIWEPNYDVHTAPAVNHAQDTYGLTTTTSDAARLAYSGVKAEFAEAQKVSVQVDSSTTHATKYSSYFEEVTPTHTTKVGFSENLEAWTFSAGITKVRVYMWVEGQDVDCENSASGGNITYSLSITSENV